MKKTTLVIKDEVNCRFEGLDVVTRRKISNAVKFVLPYARHTPAFKMGRWDGTLRFCDIGGRTYINVLDRLLPVVQQAGYEVVVEDRRRQHDAFEFEAVDTNTMSNHRWPEGHRFAGEPVQLMDHQVEAINCYLQNPQCVQSISTGAGKTMITAVLSSRCEHRGRTVVIVPSKDLVDQTHAQYDDLGMDVGVIYGNRKQYDCTHTICTWQSLESVSRRFRDGVDTVDLSQWAQDVVCVMVDECFHEDTPVLTPTGYVPICDIQPGDEVINRDDSTGEFKVDIVVKKHENLVKSQSEDMLELEFDNGTVLKVTANHKFLTDRGWVRADQITPEDSIVEVNRT